MEAKLYKKQASLLLKLLPLVMNEEVFALKGGTAINFFVRDYPRLSIDIDLTYLPVDERNKSLFDINERINSIQQRIKEKFPLFILTERSDKTSKLLTGCTIYGDDAFIKLEVNTTLRGTVLPVVSRTVVRSATADFEVSFSVPTLSFEDLYAGKICAALDRQHPRDLFDVKLLLENEGFTNELRKVFLVYLISSPRPISELLKPNEIEISTTWMNEFKGMTKLDVSLEELNKTRTNLFYLVRESLSQNEKLFLISFKELTPEWSLLGLDGIENLPAVRWKLHNLALMKRDKHVEALQKLKKVLDNS